MAGGNALGDVATWTGLSASQLSGLDPSTHRPIPNPSKIAERIAEVQAKWSDEERSRRQAGGRDVWMIPGAGGDLHIETEEAKASE